MRGLVEQLHDIEGVHGWVYDPAEPQLALDVELWAGTLCLARTQTGLERPDVCSSLGVSCRPGFRFGDEIGAAIAEAAAEGHRGELAVRVRGYGRLETQSPPLTLEMLRPVSKPLDHIGDRLRATLKRHLSQATSWLNNVGANELGERIGYLEGVWISRSGLIWLVGWMVEDAVFDRPVIILDTALHPAGVAFSFAERADIGPNAKAFVAVMQSDWEVDPDLPPQIALPDGSGRHLESVRSAPLTGRETILPVIRDTLARSSGPHRAAMLRLLEANRGSSTVQSAADRVHVDEVAVLPGFGAFVSGWALSPSKRAKRFSFELGDRTINADELSQTHFARADIANLLPYTEQALESAGFTSLFRHPINQVTIGQLSLNVEWHDGSITSAEISPDAIRTVGLTASFESICRFYHAAEAEEFFADLAYHAARSAQAEARFVQPYVVQRSRASLLLAVPAQAPDIFLLFDQALAYAASLPEDWGIAFIAKSGEHRGLTLTLFAQLQRATDRPCSLFFTRTAVPTTDVIDSVASALSSERIAWVAGHVALTATGWKHVATQDGSLVLLGVDDPAGGAQADPDLDAFVVDFSRWRRLCAAAAPQIGGIQLPPHIEALPVIPNAGVLLGAASKSPFTRKINEAVRRAYG